MENENNLISSGQAQSKSVILLEIMISKIKKNIWGILTFLLIAIGLSLSFKLFNLDVGLWSGEREFPSACNLSEFVNCDAASMSDYAKTLDIPNALIGFAFYSIFFLLALINLFRRSLYVRRLIFVFGAVSTAFSIYMASISIFVLKTLCLFCCATYLANILIMAFSKLDLRENFYFIFKEFSKETINRLRGFFSKVKEERKNSYSFYTFFILSLMSVAVILLMGTNFFNKKTNISGLDARNIIARHLMRPLLNVDISETTTPWGKKGAKLKIVEFSDFKCPFCRKAAFTIKTLLKQHENDVELVFKNYPIENTCNPNIKNAMHPKACLMAKAVICADKFDKFWRFHDLLFENATLVSRSKILALAQGEDINVEQFDKCIDSDKTKELLDLELLDADKVSISATPTFIVNGRVIRGLLPPKVLDLIIKYELSNEKNFK